MPKMNSTGMMSALWCVCFFCFFTQTNANELSDALDVMYTGEIDPSTARSITNLTITHTDITLNLRNGTIVFYQPITLYGKPHYWGGFFVGEGQFNFVPPIKMERDQLQRFFKTDSLSGIFFEVAFLFSDSIYNLIQTNSASVSPVDKTVADKGDNYRKDFTKNENRNFVFTTLKAHAESTTEPLLLAALRPLDIGYIWYYFNPFEREEVSLFKEYKQFPSDVMEKVCQYSQFVQPDHLMLNGLSKDDIATIHFDIDATIARDGMFRGKAKVSYSIVNDPLKMFSVDLDPELIIDSIVAGGTQVPFRRFTGINNKQYELYLLPNTALRSGDTAIFTYYYSGMIARSYIDVFYVSAMYGWYPEYGWRQPATYSLSFHTPKGIEFVATGTLKEREEKDNKLHTRWEFAEPVDRASFTIGFIKKYRFTDENAGTVDVYYDENVARLFAQYYAGMFPERPALDEPDSTRGLPDHVAGIPDSSWKLPVYTLKLGASMEKQVADDLINAIRLFSHRFGSRPDNYLSASEIPAWHGQSFPGFLHLSAATWMRTDKYGNNHLFRAHEVAHQWWGTGVGYETYHDQWLSEGFATYSALMYLQSIKGNDKFLEKLEEYRKEIFNNRKFLFGNAEQEGPIALGYRTQSSRTADDAYDLIIYKKGALVLHMLRNLFLDLNTMNEDAFFDMMKEWYSTYQGKVATTADFKRLTEKYVGVDMGWFFDQWIYGTELPTYTFSYEILSDLNNTYKAVCTVLSEGVDNTFVTDVPVQIQFDKERSAYIRIVVSGQKTEFSIPGLTEKPVKIIFNVFESILAEVKQ